MRALVLSLFCAAMVSESSAHAPHEREQVYAVVEQARASLDGASLVVDVALEPRSFAWLRSQGIAPTVVVSFAGQAYQQLMRDARDAVVLNLPRGTRPEPVEVRIIGADGRRDIDYLVVGGVELTSLPLRVRGIMPGPPNLPPHLPWPGQTNVIKACGDAFEGSTNENACLDAVIPFVYDPSEMIAVCDATMEGDDNELACVNTAVKLPWAAPAAYRACDDAMEGDVNELSCFALMATINYEPSNAIRACDEAMEGDDNELACIGVIARAPVDPSALVRTCDESMSGDEAELGCVRRGIGW